MRPLATLLSNVSLQVDCCCGICKASCGEIKGTTKIPFEEKANILSGLSEPNGKRICRFFGVDSDLADLGSTAFFFSNTVLDFEVDT